MEKEEEIKSLEREIEQLMKERQQLEKGLLEKLRMQRIMLEEDHVRQFQNKSLEMMRFQLKKADTLNKEELWSCTMKVSGSPDCFSISHFIRDFEKMKTIVKGNTFQDIELCLDIIDDIDDAILNCPTLTEEDEKRCNHIQKHTKEMISRKLKCVIYQGLMERKKFIKTDANNSEFTLHFPPEDENPLISFYFWIYSPQNLRFFGMTDEERGLKFQVPSIMVDSECAVVLMHTRFDHFSQRRLSPMMYFPFDKPENTIFLVKPDPDPELVDLAEYYVVGGMYSIMAMKPPKLSVKAGPGMMSDNDGENRVEALPYKAKITPKRMPEPNMTPDEADEFADAETRRFQNEMLESISITIRLPKNVLFLEQPVPALFLPEKRGFTTSGFFDVRYDDDTGSLSFKVNQFGDIGLMTKKYANFPFQSWELEQGVFPHQSLLTLNGPIVCLQIIINDEGCSILSIKHRDQSMFEHLYHCSMTPYELVQNLSFVGINILAEDDGFSYIGVQPKHSNVEDSTYFGMALLCNFCSFSSSHWNRTLSPDKIVFKFIKGIKQVQPKKVFYGTAMAFCTITQSEVERKRKEAFKQKVEMKTHPLFVMVTPERAVFLKMKKSSEMFSEEPVDGQQFFSDCYHLIHNDLPGESELPFPNMLHSINVYLMLSMCKLFSCS